MSHFALRGIGKSFAGRAAVADIDLTAGQGELLALLGPSGCGKTTTLNIVAGFLSPDTGSVLLDGRPIERLPPRRRQMGMVFQSYALFPHLTVEDNVGFGLEARGVARRERRARARAMLALVGLDGYATRYPRAMSGGQQQRVALARALVIEPRMLLLDEPFSNLDATLRHQLRDEVRRIQRRVGITTLFVTHDQEEAIAIADRVAVMNAGRVEQVGAPEDVYDRPRTAFVARFLGEANILRGSVASVTADGVLTADIGGCPVTARAADPPHRRGAPVGVCIRPERILLAAADSPGGGLRGQVMERVYLGARCRYVVRTATLPIIVSTNAHGPRFAEGSAVALSWQAADASVLTGEAAG